MTVQTGISPSSFAAERYRNLAVRIKECASKGRSSGYLLSVTSAEPGAGKTLTSLNLALTLARKSEMRVLLVECDLWKPDLSSYLEVEELNPGLKQILEKQAKLNDVVVSVWGTGLDVLTAGTTGEVDNLLADQRMAKTIAKIRSHYEIVILDSAPILLASGKSLASLADGALLVVRAGQTRRRDLEEALSTLEPSKVLGLALNGVRRSRLSSPAYGAYAYYGPERAWSIGRKMISRNPRTEAEPLPRDLPMEDAGIESYPDAAIPRRQGWRVFGWKTVLGGLAVVVVAGVLSVKLLRDRNGEAPSESRPTASDSSDQREGARERAPEAQEVASDIRGAKGRMSLSVPLRGGSGLEHRILTILPAEVAVEILETRGDWLRVQTAEREGWVLKPFVMLDTAEDPEEGPGGVPPL